MKSTFKAVSIIIAILLSYSANAESKDRKNSIETTTQLAFDQLFNVLLLKKNEFETTNELTERTINNGQLKSPIQQETR